MRNGLYHYVTGLPDVKLPKSIALTYSKHAERQMLEDRYGVIVAPDSLNIADGKLIEIEVSEHKAIKIVIRIKYNAKHDLVLVVKPHDGFVKTVWLNQVDDVHSTLDRSRYVIIKGGVGSKSNQL